VLFIAMKKAIVIGASSGIGKEIAKILIENNYQVGITGRRTHLLNELKSSNSNYFVKIFDITNSKSSIENLSELVSELGGLDLLVLSSGTGDLNQSLDFEIEKRTIDTNVLGFTNIADWAFNYFEKERKGHFVAISSIGGLRGSRQAPAYNASKAYQINYLEALNQKAANLNISISITDIQAGLIDTAMAKGEGLFWVAPVEKAAKQIFNAIRLKKEKVYVTKRWTLIALFFKFAPNFIFKKL
jgi:short-subunit dehydrogenase